MEKEVKIIMLPTKDKSCITFDGTKITLHSHAVWNRKMEKPLMQHLYATIPQNVEPIKEGCYVISNNKLYKVVVTGVLYNDEYTVQTEDEGVFLNPKYCRKVIATTDPKLTIVKKYESKLNPKGYKEQKEPIPQLQQSFLKEFVANPDGEFEVEYDRYQDFNVGGIDNLAYKYKLKLNQDNTVTIHPLEINKERAVFEWLSKKDYLTDGLEILYKEWIKENL